MKTAARLRRREPAGEGDWPESMSPLLRRIYAARGATCLEQAQPRLAQLLPPDGMLGLDAATQLLFDAIAADRHILVVGDFDCDGATACAVGVRGLRMLGAKRVSHAVPNRIVHGYGLSPALVEELAGLQPDLLVTVDHGIACHAGIAAARERGWQVLVTDHHLPGERLPLADAIVDPNQHGDAFPSKMLAGVGVMFYVLLALRRRMREAGSFADAGPDLTVLLDLVAVGTVADLVSLDANNRALVAAGLRRLRAGQGSAGLRALIEVSQRDYRRLTAADIGYALAPRLNAAGRLEDMALGIECLITDDAVQARYIASTLNDINAERRAVQQQMTDEAELAFARVSIDAQAAPLALCLFDPDWHPGVVGLVASKMKERLHRPVIAFAPAEPGSDQLRGSARSIPGFHIRDALADVAARHPDLIERFGGHAMAAGLSLRQDAFETFRGAFELCARAALTPELLQADVLSDGELATAEFDRAHAESLRDAGPWGQGFAEPQFDGEFEVLSWRVVGERHLKLELGRDGLRLNAIEFGGWDGNRPPPWVRIAYRLEPDDYRGGNAVQLVVVHREAL
ncbi:MULTISPECIES: single-stranded-DNA-specific exonuclease RecJ [unclassified Lysobacter]|uniref:single-stranded-DNA-specific exonuclease RecJ n=1 Tax=unclassified Lysobacter TaxID=2635362 RepID=UPI001BE7DDFB|nr:MULTISPECIES: single-stranded-DNA-specific exonuclease RecJ [unclassified Lysobacter]MBT2745327.1 single-stranded-DNA-specific exonuclease RecJ [Lysobacter sp. ISL-42]MBT2751924.1 single-stranded-DNA-specific exonuclease RecJ [Lysobacter sp. ISL-50]MBT2777889.1 single-stranded-DNA-specific exonuclease RecJ [Lysobacter sp. ISL-54]MBT2783145.1 single-stranded-DNA-specific exonuclease RecJ [Lysobacter sp. ISL-52]